MMPIPLSGKTKLGLEEYDPKHIKKLNGIKVLIERAGNSRNYFTDVYEITNPKDPSQVIKQPVIICWLGGFLNCSI